MKISIKEKELSLFDFYMEFLTIVIRIKLTPKETQVVAYLMMLNTENKSFTKEERFKIESLITNKPVEEITQTSIINNLLCTSLTTKKINGEYLMVKNKKTYILHSKLQEIINNIKSKGTVEITFKYNVI